MAFDRTVSTASRTSGWSVSPGWPSETDRSYGPMKTKPSSGTARMSSRVATAASVSIVAPTSVSASSVEI